MAVLDLPSPVDDPPAIADLAARLRWYRHGRHDPTTRIGPTGMVRAVLTEDGPATFAMSWATGTLEVEAWGPGADRGRGATPAAWPRSTAARRRCPTCTRSSPPAARRFPGLWAGASGDLYHALLPSIIAQRITSGEAIRQWSRLCRELGEPAPGPALGLVLPPHPDRLAGRPAWWFHPLGIEAKRARALTRGRPGRPPAVGVGPAAHRRRRGQAPADPRGRAVDGRLGPRPRLRRRRCGRGRRLPPAEHRQLEPRRRAAWHRRPYARPPRTVPRPARPGRPAARARRTKTAQVRPPPPRPPHASMVTTPATTSVTVTDEVTVADDGAAATTDVVAPQPVADESERRDWYRAVAIGMAAFVVSRLCVLAGAGVRASQVVVDANNDGEPRPGTPLGPDRQRPHPVGRALVHGDRPRWLPAVDPAGHHVLPAGGAGRLLPAVSDPGAGRRPDPARRRHLRRPVRELGARRDRRRARRRARPPVVRRPGRRAGDGAVRRLPRAPSCSRTPTPRRC